MKLKSATGGNRKTKKLNTLEGRPPLLAASEPLFQYSYTSLARQKLLYSLFLDSLPPTLFHIASGIHLCRRGTAMEEID